jgi:hypothetical protein
MHAHRTLRCYSLPMDLDERASRDWLLERGDEGSRAVAHELDELRHMMLFERREIKQGLRPADRLVLRTTVAQREWQARPTPSPEDFLFPLSSSVMRVELASTSRMRHLGKDAVRGLPDR